MKFSIKDFTFTEEILHGKLHFLFSVALNQMQQIALMYFNEKKFGGKKMPPRAPKSFCHFRTKSLENLISRIFKNQNVAGI